ncbi:aldo/keto reductase [Sphingomonas sp. HF-S3]|uniref:Aldo/keto reductase n=1 Tax=Sphingomonas rustica TaxID=3103142 RepID=A0ABV0BDR2_9SPHN
MSELRPVGTSGLQIRPLVLGGNVFDWTADKATSFRILDRFAEAGQVMIDTADVYSAWIPGHQGGESETVIGEWLKTSGKRDKVVLATKVGMLPGEGGEKLAPARIAAAAEASLKRLGVETIDLYYAHQDDDAVPQAEVLAAFARLIDAGKVHAIGASNFSAIRLKSALDLATKEGLPHYRALQNEYNLVSRHKFEGEMQDLCVTHNIAGLPFYGLASGYLTGKYRSAEDTGKSVRGGRMGAYMDGNGPAVLAVMDQVAAETGASLAQIALAWLMAQPGITAPIASATSIEQLEELLGALDVELSADQLERLSEAGV